MFMFTVISRKGQQSHKKKKNSNLHVFGQKKIQHKPTNTLLNSDLLKPTGHVMHQQFNIQQLYVLPTLYLRVLYLSQNKQRLTVQTDWFLQPRWKMFTARYELDL